MSRERWMTLFFALGATCFFIGPFPGYAQLVGASADADTFFIGSIFFTSAAFLQFRASGGGDRLETGWLPVSFGERSA